MNNKKYFALALMCASVTALSVITAANDGQQDGQKDRYRLTVANGNGDGFYIAGEAVHIEANPTTNDRNNNCSKDVPLSVVFDRWAGDVQAIDSASNGYDERSWHTVVSMPHEKAHFKAVYKSGRQWQAQVNEMDGTQYHYHFPENPKGVAVKGVVVLLHGAGGSASNWTETRGTQRRFAEKLVIEGYGIVAVESKNRVNKIWDFRLPARNSDFPNVKAIIDNLTLEFGLEGVPLFAVGISAGGFFASELTHFDRRIGLPDFSAQALFISPGVKAVFRGVFGAPNVPTLWLLAENEDIIASGNADAQIHKAALDEVGVKADLFWLRPSPLHKLRFWRICGIGRAESQEIYRALVTNGLLDESNRLNEHPLFPGRAEVDPIFKYPPPQSGSRWSDFYWKSVFPKFGRKLGNRIWRELSQVWARHIFFNEYDNHVVEFFDQVLEEQQ